MSKRRGVLNNATYIYAMMMKWQYNILSLLYKSIPYYGMLFNLNSRYIKNHIFNLTLIFLFISRSTRGFMHMRICRGAEGYTLGGAATAFPTVSALMRHYVTAQRLPVRGAEHMALCTPLPAVLLWVFHAEYMGNNLEGAKVRWNNIVIAAGFEFRGIFCF